METLSPELMASLTLTGGLGFVMVRIARWKGMIEECDSGRRYPSRGFLVALGRCCACSERAR